MGRYTRGDASWEITRDGTTLTLVEDGATTVETLPSAKLAETRERVLINQRARDGWKLYRPPAPVVEPYVPPPQLPVVYDARNPALEAAILEDPDNLSLYEVYGDWLQAQNDPRGRLIALEVATRGKPFGDKHWAAWSRCLDQHRAYFEAGFPKDCNIALRLGFAWKLELLTGRFAKPVAKLLKSPAARFLTTVHLDAQPDDGEPAAVAEDLVTALRVIAKHTPLRSLTIGGGTTLAKLGPVTQRLPTLRELSLSNMSDRELEVGAPVLRELCASPLPRLEVLELELLRGPCGVAELEPLFARRDLAALTTLSVRTPFEVELVGALIGTPLGRQLETLGLGTHATATAAASQLLARRDELPALRTVALPVASVAEPLRTQLQAAFTVTNDDGSHRYEHGVE